MSCLKVKIHNKEFKFDYDDFTNLCGNSESTYIYRWKLNDNYQPYIVDKNSNVIYKE